MPELLPHGSGLRPSTPVLPQLKLRDLPLLIGYVGCFASVVLLLGLIGAALLLLEAIFAIVVTAFLAILIIAVGVGLAVLSFRGWRSRDGSALRGPRT